jgi:hypothetical protein
VQLLKTARAKVAKTVGQYRDYRLRHALKTACALGAKRACKDLWERELIEAPYLIDHAFVYVLSEYYTGDNFSQRQLPDFIVPAPCFGRMLRRPQYFIEFYKHGFVMPRDLLCEGYSGENRQCRAGCFNPIVVQGQDGAAGQHTAQRGDYAERGQLAQG